ncbi:unnamed protein product [Linum tenue]|uniref:Uncharacterized protein n=1 Tax=Linum tenue TaxID=586396 RepID=A0AAV0JIM9_9ROSI|nr:unnamed protein product [Linum tenue]
MSPTMSFESAAGPSHVTDRIEPAKFQRTLWGDHFLMANTTEGHPAQELEIREHEVLKEEVRRMVTADEFNGAVDDVNVQAITQKLRLIDVVQRLGLGYQFETEIEEALEKVYVHGGESFIQKDINIDMYHAALWFRLLRQQGFRVSPDGFKRFMDDEGQFKELLASDELGLLSLYEAAHVAFNGEDILDEAMEFATKNLKSIIKNYKDSSLSKKHVEFSLSLPVWKCVPRTLARHSIDVYSQDENACHDQTVILRLAKLDFNMVQKFHKQELHQLSLWWASLETTTKFTYAKDRLAECYFWINGAYFEPRYQLARIILAKIGCVVTLLDDTYDNYGNYKELELLTQAIQRLDIGGLELLSGKLKEVYQIVIDLFEDIEQELTRSGLSTLGVDYSKGQFKKMCWAFLAEVRWRTTGQVPALEEYLMDANVTSSYPFHCTASFLGMEAEEVTKEAYEWFERKRKHAASAVECYMKEHDVSQEDAVVVLWEEISKSWKTIIKECEKPTLFSTAVTDRVLNFARVISVMYGNGDAFTHPHLLKGHIASLFANPVPL